MTSPCICICINICKWILICIWIFICIRIFPGWGWNSLAWWSWATIRWIGRSAGCRSPPVTNHHNHHLHKHDHNPGYGRDHHHGHQIMILVMDMITIIIIISEYQLRYLDGMFYWTGSFSESYDGRRAKSIFNLIRYKLDTQLCKSNAPGIFFLSTNWPLSKESFIWQRNNQEKYNSDYSNISVSKTTRELQLEWTKVRNLSLFHCFILLHLFVCCSALNAWCYFFSATS